MAYAEEGEGTWYPFFFPEKLDKDSCLNIGRLILDAPAGKHGFVKALDNLMYFDDNTPANFWGTTLCFKACFPPKDYAEILVNRIAFFGFNLVRLHHMDSQFEPKGIFKDNIVDALNPLGKKTGYLSAGQMDRLDYIIYLLKNRGIYIDMNLLVARHFTEADGVRDASKLGKGIKAAAMFDSKLIELQKKYANDLLTHYNPYTHLRYCDDPAICLVEISNEKSIFSPARASLPDYYKNELDEKLKIYAKQMSGKSFSLSPASINLVGFYSYLEKEYFIEMKDYLRDKVGVKKKKELGVKALIGVGAYDDVKQIGTQTVLDYIDCHTFWDYPSYPHKIGDKNNFRIHNKSVLLEKDLGSVGKALKAFELSKKEMVEDLHEPKPFTVTAWNHCHPNKYAYETPVLIAAEARANEWSALCQYSFSHGWNSTTSFDLIFSPYDIIGNAQQLLLCSVGSVLYLREKDPSFPFTIKNGVYTIDSDRVKGVCGFIKGKTFEMDSIIISTKEDGAVFIYSADSAKFDKSQRLVLVTVGEIKNSKSGWKKDRYDWGLCPTMLKRCPTMVVFKRIVWGYKVYALSSDGKRQKEVPVTKGMFTTEGYDTPCFEIIPSPSLSSTP